VTGLSPSLIHSLSHSLTHSLSLSLTHSLTLSRKGAYLQPASPAAGCWLLAAAVAVAGFRARELTYNLPHLLLLDAAAAAGCLDCWLLLTYNLPHLLLLLLTASAACF
jgi:hypothetical protein